MQVNLVRSAREQTRPPLHHLHPLSAPPPTRCFHPVIAALQLSLLFPTEDVAHNVALRIASPTITSYAGEICSDIGKAGNNGRERRKEERIETSASRTDRVRIHREQPRYNRTTDRPNPIRRPIPGTTRTLRVRDRQSVPGSTDGQPRDLHGGGGAGAGAAAGCCCCCCWWCCCCCCCQSVVVEAVVVVVTVEVEDGPALEEAGASTAPTPGFVPTTSPVDNATATPGSFRFSSSSVSSSSSFHFPPSFTFSAALLLNFLPLPSSPFASLRLLPILLLFSLSSSSSSSNCTVTLASHDSSRHHLRVLVDSLPSPSSRTPLLRSPPTFAFSYLSHDSFSSDGISLFQRRGSCFPPSSVHPSTLLAVVAATPASSSLSHASRVRAEPDEIQRRSA